MMGPKYTASTTLLFWKSYDPQFITNKLDIRKALTLAVDWEGLFKAIYPPDVAEPYRGGGAIFTPLSMGYDSSLAPTASIPPRRSGCFSRGATRGRRSSSGASPRSRIPSRRK